MTANNAADAFGKDKTVFGTNQQNLLALVEASPLGIIAIDLDGRIILWNRAAEEITGWREKEVLGLPIWVLAGDKGEEYVSLSRRTLNREVFHSLPMEATRKDCRRIVISYSAAPVFDSENNVVATMAVIYDISEKMKLEADLKESLEKRNRILDETVRSLSSAVEKRDPYTAGHQQRVAQLACALVGELGGDVGYQILKDVEFQWPVPLIVRQHHESPDGSGYPVGLKGDEILFETRIVGVADVVESMSSHRPFRPAKGVEAALQEIRSARGTAYDPSVVDACVTLFRNGFDFS